MSFFEAAICLAAVVFILGFVILNQISNYLVVDHDLAEVDAIVVLIGGLETKVSEAADLYLEGYTDKIIMARTYTGNLEPDIESGVLAKGETERSRLILIDLGVPKEAVIILPSMTRSIHDKEVTVLDYVANRQYISSMILAVYSAHSRRILI